MKGRKLTDEEFRRVFEWFMFKEWLCPFYPLANRECPHICAQLWPGLSICPCDAWGMEKTIKKVTELLARSI